MIAHTLLILFTCSMAETLSESDMLTDSADDAPHIDADVYTKQGPPEYLSRDDFIEQSKTLMKCSIYDFIKQLAYRTPDDMKLWGSTDTSHDKSYYRFEGGVAIIKGLTMSQAEKIYNYMWNLHGRYERKSTHGDMVEGWDFRNRRPYINTSTYSMNLSSDQAIKSEGKTYRTSVFAFPKPYKNGDDLNAGSSSYGEEPDKNYYTTNKYTDVQFFVRIKPEEWGFDTNSGNWNPFDSHSEDMYNHSGSAVSSWVCPGYKEKMTYYGDGNGNLKMNGNGCLVIDVSLKQINPWSAFATQEQMERAEISGLGDKWVARKELRWNVMNSGKYGAYDDSWPWQRAFANYHKKVGKFSFDGQTVLSGWGNTMGTSSPPGYDCYPKFNPKNDTHEMKTELQKLLNEAWYDNDKCSKQLDPFFINNLAWQIHALEQRIRNEY